MEVRNFILDNFKDKLNIFFVLFDDYGYFISTFAIDTANKGPYISHLFVNKKLRGNGYGVKSLKLAEIYTKKLGFMMVNLWCEDYMIDFYKKNGYIIDKSIEINPSHIVWIMCKNV